MTAQLIEAIESPRTAAEFYLASSIDWLYAWISRQPAVQALEAVAAEDANGAELIADRSLCLLDAPIKAGYRSGHEPALCCYAFVLALSQRTVARIAVERLEASAAPEYGWLGPVLQVALGRTTTIQWDGSLVTNPGIYLEFEDTVDVTEWSESLVSAVSDEFVFGPAVTATDPLDRAA